LSLFVSPEYDGNVPLSPLDMDSPSFPAWRSKPGASMDGDVLMLASLLVRPLPSGRGLSLGNTLSYRQQFLLGEYNLLLDSTSISYGYFGAANWFRAAATFSFALLGGSTLYLEGDAKAAYRRRLAGKLGLLFNYHARYRNYRNPDYAPLTGLTQSLQLDLGWGTAPQPVSIGVSFQAIREETQTPTETDPTDYRAWAFGPSLWMRARLHKRVELAVSSTFLHRIFDSTRVDNALLSDLNLNITLTSWLETFLGSTFIFNGSSDPQFHYFKPAVSAGLAAYFGFF
jgi:hypothetical protein